MLGVVDHRHELRSLQPQVQLQRARTPIEHARIEHVLLREIPRGGVRDARQHFVQRDPGDEHAAAPVMHHAVRHRDVSPRPVEAGHLHDADVARLRRVPGAGGRGREVLHEKPVRRRQLACDALLGRLDVGVPRGRGLGLRLRGLRRGCERRQTCREQRDESDQVPSRHRCPLCVEHQPIRGQEIQDGACRAQPHRPDRHELEERHQ